MNERIRELWEESTVSTWPRPGKFTAGEYDYHLEKFAELIVRECNICANQYIIDCGEVSCLPDYVLESHFGVKE